VVDGKKYSVENHSNQDEKEVTKGQHQTDILSKMYPY
jgi:hypothetical protein